MTTSASSLSPAGDAEALPGPEVWVEPARRARLGWGGYTARYATGLVFVGLTLVVLPLSVLHNGSSAEVYQAAFAAFGIAAAVLIPAQGRVRALAIGSHVIAAILPGLLWRPFAVIYGITAGNALLCAWTASVGLLIVEWLLIRQRGRRAYIVAIPFLLLSAVAILVVLPGLPGGAITSILTSYVVAPVALASVLLLPAAAWIAQTIDRRGRPMRVSPAPIAAGANIQGIPATQQSTNGLAIAGFVLTVTGVAVIVGIVLSHVALSQIRRTGQAGRGLALAGVIIGYVGVGLFVVTLVALLAVGALSGLY